MGRGARGVPLRSGELLVLLSPFPVLTLDDELRLEAFGKCRVTVGKAGAAVHDPFLLHDEGCGPGFIDEVTANVVAGLDTIDVPGRRAQGDLRRRPIEV